MSILKLDLDRDNAKFQKLEKYFILNFNFDIFKLSKKSEINYFKSENNRLKIDYLDILQSFLACSSDYQNSNVPNENQSISNLSLSHDHSIESTKLSDSAKQFTLFGGEKHKNRLREFIEECRRSDPTFPSWESITSNECFVDKYGFKYNKSNECSLIHYICQHLSLFYRSQPKLQEVYLWERRLKEWKKSFYPSKEIKNWIRNGILPKYRSEYWKLCINRQVEDIKKSKGPNYYQFLSNLSNDLPVFKIIIITILNVIYFLFLNYFNRV